MIGRYFDSGKIKVVNRAVCGLSSRTFLTLGHWDQVMTELKPGDFVMMQFGHNDSGPLDDTARARGTIKGVGEETREIDNPTTGKPHGIRKITRVGRRRFSAPIAVKCALVT
jgi:hypothetical protein